jgi:porin-like protein
MKMVRCLLLGTAAGFFAVTAAQAADMENENEVKAPKAADYVKVCNLYGEGFYQIPGQGDVCIRIGATARLDGGFNADGNGGPFIGSGADSRNNRIDTRDFLFHGRGTAWFDARQMTQYGVLKAYFSGGFDASTGASATTGSPFWKRGYIGFAGATIGKTQSFFDFLNGAFSYGAYHLGGGSNTYDTGTLLAAYTAEFGLGISATASIEDSGARRNALWDAGTNALSIGSFPGPSGTSVIGSTICNSQSVAADSAPGPAVANLTGCPVGDYAANQIPDVVGNLRVDQGWGSAQVAGAFHQVRAGFYGNNVSPVGPPNVGPAEFTGQAPADKWGFALMGGAMANVPTGTGDKLWANIVYTQGALAYTGLSQFGSFGTFSRFNGGSVGAAWALDGVFANTVGPAGTVLSPSGIQLTKAWSVGAAYEHHWNPQLRSSVFGAITSVSYPGDLTSGAKAVFCSSPVGPVRNAAGGAPSFGAPVAGCNPDFMVWGVGTRTVWNPVRNLDLGAEVMYSRLDQNMGSGVLLNFSGSGGTPAGNYTPQNQSIWSGLLRAQWHFGAPPTEESRS